MLRFLVFVSFTIMASACLKDSKSGCSYQPTGKTAGAAEIDSLEAYLDSNGIQAIKDPRGFYYKIIFPGTPIDTLGLCSEVMVTYTGKTAAADTVFDKGTDVQYTLGRFIDGWRYGLQLAGKGGQIQLFIPPSLGYGNVEVRDRNTNKLVIPANSILVFDVKLTNYSADPY